jgi:hypothetical protein
LRRWTTLRKFVSTENIAGWLTAVAAGTTVAFLLRFFFPLLVPDEEILRAYVRRSLPPHAVAMALTFCIAILAIIIADVVARIWRSLRLGLIRLPLWFWVCAVAGFWLLLESRHFRLALGALVSAVVLSLVMRACARKTADTPRQDSLIFDPDLPVPEDGEDLLGRRPLVEELVSRILLEKPLVIAVTAPYGVGKTSFLNLVVGEIRKAEPAKLPIIVKFSPWLAGDSNTLVLSLLNSIVSEINKLYFVPGLKRDAMEYARTLLKVVPKLDSLKEVLSEPSQEDRILGLTRRILATGRRILVVLDDLDRMDAAEVGTVFKLLRGSEAFGQFTFLCSFDRTELIRILEATRPKQDASTFIEKFFQVPMPLPPIDSAQLQEVFSGKLKQVLRRCNLSDDITDKTLTDIWERGGGDFFQNLRRIKLFLNKMDQSLTRIGREVNVADLLRLELVRDVAPSIYDAIYLNPENFYDSDLAFEVRFKNRASLDATEAKKARGRFYTAMMEPILGDKKYVEQILADLFPHFAEYKGRHVGRAIEEGQAERDRRIFHPRYFRQYFQLKVPSELFSQREFDAFLARIKGAPEEKVIAFFNETFRALEKEDFKRYHFLHRIEGVFDSFSLEVERGLCRGFAQNSSIWSSDAFEFMIAVRCTRTVLHRITDDPEKERFLMTDIRESTSSLCALLLVQILEKEDRGALPSNLAAITDTLKQKLREKYLRRDAPSIFEEFKTDMGRIEPIQFLLSWKRLGPDAESEQQQYLLNLLERRPADLDLFLKSMFRVDFMDDYAALKQLIDYNLLAPLVEKHAPVLDPEKIEQFRKRRKADQQSAPPSPSEE